jgi:outer membrane protein TolC
MGTTTYAPARRRALRLVPLAALALAACAPLQTRQTLQTADALTRQHTGVELQLQRDDAARAQAQAQIDALLARPLAADDAVRVAVLGSPALQALLAQAQADSAASTQSARLSNPAFGLERLLGGGIEITRSLSVGLLDLLTQPVRARIDAARQQQLRLQLAQQVLRVAATARVAWVRAVAAQQLVAYDRDVIAAAQATATLAERMRQAGNATALDAAQQALFAADAQMRLQRDALAATQTREALVRALGLSPEQAQRLQLPAQLPKLPAELRAAAAAPLQAAIDSRLDVQLARAALQTRLQAAGLEHATSVIGHVELGGVRKTYSDAPAQNGFDLSLPLPLFDLGDARRSAAADAVLAARNRVIAVARDAASQLREADALRRSAWTQARDMQQTVLPLAQTVLDESQLRYNGMLIGTFQLVAAAQTQVQAVRAAIAAQRDYWLADAVWQAARLGVDLGVTAAADAASASVSAATVGH